MRTLTLAVCFLCAFVFADASVAGEQLDLRREAELQWDSMMVAFFQEEPGTWSFNQLVRETTGRAYHPQAGLMEDDRDPADVILRRTRALLRDLRTGHPGLDLSAEASELEALAEGIQSSEPEWEEKVWRIPLTKGQGGMKVNDWQEVEGRAVANRSERLPLFTQVYLLQRRIAFKNPLLNFDRIVFVKKHPAALSHMVDQYFGIVQVPGGGLFVLEDAFTDSPRAVDCLADSVCGNGRLEGRKLTPGAFYAPDLSYDGRKIYFSHTETKEFFGHGQAQAKGKVSFRSEDTPYAWDETTSFHIFSVNVDGSGLTMLTDGPHNDFDPCLLPNGRIAFVSERRGGEGRCHPRPCPTYVLHSMLPDGSDITPLSYHETNEWHPSVNNEGEIVYSRWDYVDRKVGAGQFPWVTKPDGRDARALFGNYDEARLGGAQFEPMAIPGTNKYVATICGHHSQSYGPLAVFDMSVPELVNEEKTVVHLTPEQAGKLTPSAYTSPWPLDEHYFLVSYSPQSRRLAGASYKMIPYDQPVQHGLYLLDAFGNRQLLYRDESIGSQNPIPLKPRPRPRVMPHAVDHAFPPGRDPQEEAETPATATLAVMDVYASLKPWPEDRKVSRLRVVQIYPKSTPFQDNPPIGHAAMMNARASLGSVPVEADGSAHFVMPAKIPVYFQALDEDGLAVQTMMSDVYAHPGETLTCVGCHEPPSMTAPAKSSMPRAMQRPPSRLKPDVSRGEPMNFARIVQPVLDKRCVECHQKHDKAPDLTGERPEKGRNRHVWSRAYLNLQPYIWYIDGRERGDDNPHRMRSRSTPGEVGAHESKLYQMLVSGSHEERVELTEEELACITLWIDLSAPFLGAYRDWNAQREGELVQPVLE